MTLFQLGTCLYVSIPSNHSCRWSWLSCMVFPIYTTGSLSQLAGFRVTEHRQCNRMKSRFSWRSGVETVSLLWSSSNLSCFFRVSGFKGTIMKTIRQYVCHVIRPLNSTPTHQSVSSPPLRTARSTLRSLARICLPSRIAVDDLTGPRSSHRKPPLKSSTWTSPAWIFRSRRSADAQPTSADVPGSAKKEPNTGRTGCGASA